jgi:peptide/nickel transport system substrate-binding protein
MNESRPPLNDIRVRKAIDYSLPYAQTQAVVADGVASPIEEYNLSPVQEYDMELDAIEAAKTFLAEAGYLDGFRTNLLTDSSLTYYGKMALALEDALDQANIEVRSEIIPSAELEDRIKNGDYDIVIIIASRLNRDLVH